jgi:serine/threonine protein phosphatase PrpC
MNSLAIVNKLKGSFRRSLTRSLVKTVLIYRLQRLRHKAATRIQKYFRGHRVRKSVPFMTHPKLFQIISFRGQASFVFLTGTFSDPPWTVLLPLEYNATLDCFVSTHFLTAHSEPGRYSVKFVVDGEWVVNSRMPTAEDMNGNINNIFEIFVEKRYVPRAHSSRNLLPEVVNMSCRRDAQVDIPRVSSAERSFSKPMHIKRSSYSTVPVRLVFRSFMAAHPKSRFAPLDSQGTADACFYDENAQIFGIADGVGEWETFGLDAGLFPKDLLGNFQREFIRRRENEFGESKEEVCGKVIEVLDQALKKTRNYGSSTALIGVVRGCVLYTVNIGDSGFVILRPREKGGNKLSEAFRSEEQQHTFNCPYQLSCFPGADEYEELSKKGLGSFVSLLKRSNLNTQDMPKDAHIDAFTLQPRDILIIATDGLFDNLFDEDLIKITEMLLGYEYEDEEFCQKLARELVAKAIVKGWDSTYKSPFSRNAAKYGQRYIGGKLDDTAVIVAMAVPQINLIN